MSLTFYEAGYDQPPAPAVGQFLELDGLHGHSLLPCDDWDKAKFRFPVTSLRIEHAVNVTVTGRTVQRRHGFWGGRWVRVRVTFVGDGDPDVDQRGWLLLSE